MMTVTKSLNAMSTMTTIFTMIMIMSLNAMRTMTTIFTMAVIGLLGSSQSSKKDDIGRRG